MTDKNKKYLVYKHTSPSGKSYIGYTCNYAKRNSQHKESWSKCVAFREAIKKYGWENFSHEVIIDGLSIDDALSHEKRLITELNTLSPNGYNLTPGGMSYERTEEVNKKLSVSLRKNTQDMERRRQLMISRNKDPKFIEKNKARIKTINIGRKASEETKIKMSRTRKGRKQSPDHSEKRIESSFLTKEKSVYYSICPFSYGYI